MLENWQIKVLENEVLDYEEWINHVKTVRKMNNGKEGDLMFPNPDLIIQNKIKVCLERMLNQYSSLDFTDLSNKEKVNLITTQEGYKNRSEREIEE